MSSTTLSTLIKRNLLVFWRDKSTVFFSFMAALIVLGLYFGFTKDMMFSGMQSSLPSLNDSDALAFLNALEFSGILLILCFTCALTGAQVIVKDRESGVFSDFFVAPVKRLQLGIGYLLSSFIVSFVMTSVVAIICFVYLGLSGGFYLTVGAVLLIFALIVLYALLFAAFSTLIIVAFIRSNGAFSGVFAIVSAASGFAAGVYVFISQMAGGVQTVLQALPLAQGTALFKQVMASAALERIVAPDSSGYGDYTSVYGFDITIGDITLEAPILVGIALIWIIVCTALLVWQIGRKIK